MEKHKVIALTGINEQRYCELQYQTGLEWLEYHSANWVFEDSRLFWNWWKNQWEMRDAKFIADFQDNHDSKTLRLIYSRRNDVKRLLDIYPPSVVLQEDYKQFAHSYVKKGGEAWAGR